MNFKVQNQKRKSSTIKKENNKEDAKKNAVRDIRKYKAKIKEGKIVPVLN
jgi:hypothetical protein